MGSWNETTSFYTEGRPVESILSHAYIKLSSLTACQSIYSKYSVKVDFYIESKLNTILQCGVLQVTSGVI